MNTFLKFFNEMINKIGSAVVENGIDWGITAIITYFTVRYATRQYYGKVKVMVAKNTMEQGLRALLKLKYNEELPGNATVIFVEYKGRCYKIRKKSTSGKECSFLGKIRRTVTSVGGDTMSVSPYRPRDYGVLGIANMLRRPVVYDFQSGEMYKYDCEKFMLLETQKEGNKYVFIESQHEKRELSQEGSARDIMIAVPIIYNDKLVGGVTFDMQVGAKTIYQKVGMNDTEKQKQKKEENNRRVFKEAIRTVNNLVNAYFKKKGEDVK